MRRSLKTLSCLSVALAVAASALAQAPATAPAASASSPLAGYIAKDRLAVYAEFQGIETHADAWNKTAASKILTETTTGAMLEDLAAQFLTQGNAALPPNARPTNAEAAALVKHVAKAGFVFAAHAKTGVGGSTTLVIRGAMRPESKAIAAQLIRGRTPANGKVQTVDKPGNRKVAVVSRADGTIASYWWIEKKEDLVLTDDPDVVIATLDKASPSVLEHPTRVNLLKAETGFEPLGVAWLDLDSFSNGLPQAAAVLSKLDLKGLKRLEYRLGTRGAAIVDEFRVAAPSPRTGLLSILDQPKFDLKTLPPVPDGVTEFAAFSVDPAKLYTQLTAFAKTANPDAEAMIQSVEATVKSKTKLRIREDILGRLGPRMIAYASPVKTTKSSGALGSLGGGGFQVPKGAMLLEMKDAKATTKMLDELMLFANKEIKTQMAAMGMAGPPGGDAPAPPRTGTTKKGGSAAAATTPEFKVSLTNPKTYVLNLPTQFAAMTNARLTIAVGKKYLVIATMPDAARDALAAEAKPPTKLLTGEVAKAIEGFPPSVMALSVSDPRDTVPEGLAKLPATIQALMNAPKPNPPGAPPAGVQAAPVTIQVDPAKIPQPDAIRPLLFPGATAVVVDDQGLRLLSRGAFPDFASMLDGIVQFQAMRGAFQPGGPGMAPPGAGAKPPGAVGGNKKGGGAGSPVVD
ncbi:MAG: hypothetical protein JWN86_3812 [Planctomycetota bacterium]|nr:hypothetical protein [Planctomycetota bacterium]